MQFIHQPLTWGFLLVLLPLLIHLINMMRHRRVEWAAMEFLLASYRKHRRWVWLKQLLLLLTRMAAVAAVVAMLAKLITQQDWGQLFGQRVTHHFVLLDDSLSMADRAAGGAAFDRGRQVVSGLAQSARNSEQSQLLSLLRFSRAARVATLPDGTLSLPDDEDRTEAVENESSPQLGVMDLNAVPINAALQKTWEEQGSSFQTTELSVDLPPALFVAEQLLKSYSDQHCVLHIISDFRSADWDQPSEVKEVLSRIEKAGVDINFVRCVEEHAPNLGVVSLTPATGTRAAGVPMLMEVVVRNFGTASADQVRLRVRSTFHPRSPQGTESAAETSELPDILIDRLDPGQTVRRTFQVFFPTPGYHEVEVELPADALLEDNRRWSVIDLEAGEPVLIVDGTPIDTSAYYLESIFRPGTKAQTGVVPNIQPIGYLRDADLDELRRYRAVYLLDVPPLDNQTLTKLKAFVSEGGGLAFFLGPNQNTTFYTNAYELGLFPAPLERAIAFETPVEETGADVQFENHPMFESFLGQRNPFAAAIRIRNYVEVERSWQAPENSGIEILARLRNGDPLVLERRVGTGYVVAFLTSLSPAWNNWALEPSFIVMALQTHAHLAQPRRPREDRRVGDEVTLQLDGSQYQPEVRVLAPGRDKSNLREFATTSVVENQQPDSTLLTAVLGGGRAGPDGIGETDTSGVYDVSLETFDGSIHHRRLALNSAPRESELKTADTGQLARVLEPVRVTIRQANQQIDASGDSQRNRWSELLLWLLLAMLLFEQWLGYRLSYHPRSTETIGGTA